MNPVVFDAASAGDRVPSPDWPEEAFDRDWLREVLDEEALARRIFPW